ncbi:hypothetical protein OPV22_004873 [Ensete ventricosum]|uniref:Uncharacterized protein n=1 Tax=Ensete ventricosum TaxID=4639 RepID=A0AAV8RHL7_ENSVE|nr:hypothetical protein OPV22_004873 [Ensete ventricosum]
MVVQARGVLVTGGLSTGLEPLECEALGLVCSCMALHFSFALAFVGDDGKRSPSSAAEGSKAEQKTKMKQVVEKEDELRRKKLHKNWNAVSFCVSWMPYRLGLG